MLNNTAPSDEWRSTCAGQVTVPPVSIQPVLGCTICGKHEEESGQRNTRNLPDTHGEGVDVFVKLVQQSNGLDDHVVYPIDVEFDFGSGVAMTKPELGLGGGLASQALHQGVEMQADT